MLLVGIFPEYLQVMCIVLIILEVTKAWITEARFTTKRNSGSATNTHAKNAAPVNPGAAMNTIRA